MSSISNEYGSRWQNQDLHNSERQITTPKSHGQLVRVKVDDGAEANILPLDSFRTMFPHALDITWLPHRRILGKIQDQP